MRRIWMLVLVVVGLGCGDSSPNDLWGGGEDLPPDDWEGEDVDEGAYADQPDESDDIVLPDSHVRMRAVFNEPEITSNKEIDTQLVALIDRALPRSTIRVSYFHFDSDTFIDAFQRALERNVDVRIVLSGESVDSSYSGQRLIEEIGEERVTVCQPEACIGSRSNANKFYLFSALARADGKEGAVAKLVVQTSANTARSHRDKFNDLTIVKRDAELYAAYRRYWKDLKSNVRNMDYHNSPNGVGYGDPATETKVMFFPTKGGDPIRKILKKASCLQGGGGVRMIYNYFGDRDRAPEHDRALNVLAELVRLKNEEGCKVEIITDRSRNRRVEELKASGVTAYQNAAVHQKLTIIDAYFDDGDGPVRKKIVMPSSHIMTTSGLRGHDNAILHIVSDKLHKVYNGHYRRVRGVSGPLE